MHTPAHARPRTLSGRTLGRTAAALGLLASTVVGTSLAAAAPASAATSSTGSRVVAEAARHKGAPYVYGADGPTRFDCSGFTKYVYSRFGKSLPHSSAAQIRYTNPVSKSAKKQGDLIFMRSSSGKINHVGIYAGGGKFWVAPKSGDHVKLQAIYSSHYSVGRVR